MTGPSARPGGTPTVAAIVGDPILETALVRAAATLGWELVLIDQPSRRRLKQPAALGGGSDITGMLVDLLPVLLVVDTGEGTRQWSQHVTTAKTNPATRRIPILGVGTGEHAGQARAAGCDAAISLEAFLADPQKTLAGHARRDDVAELARQAALPLPVAARQGVAQFNAGEYFDQHESFEHAWRAEPGPVRQLYQGLLLVGVAFLQIQRRNEAGARKTFQRARQYLSALPDVCQGVDVARFRVDAEAARRELERLGPERIDQFDPDLFCRIRLVD